MKQSERIKEIHKTKQDWGFHTETSAILEYLDEQWELNKTPEQRQAEFGAKLLSAER